MDTIDYTKLESDIIEEDWVNKSEFILQRYQLERIVKALNDKGDKINGLFLIRCMYGCNVHTAKFIYSMIIKL